MTGSVKNQINLALKAPIHLNIIKNESCFENTCIQHPKFNPIFRVNEAWKKNTLISLSVQIWQVNDFIKRLTLTR